MATDLEQELLSAAKAVKQSHLDRLKGLGVLTPALAELCGCRVTFGVVEAEEGPAGHYQPGSGPLHVVAGVYADDVLLDLVAWRPITPHKWLLRRNVAWALGADEVECGGGWDKRVTLLPHPAAWLAAGGDGVCVLDWGLEARQLANVATVAVADPALGRVLTAFLSKPVRLPRILPMEARYAA